MKSTEQNDSKEFKQLVELLSVYSGAAAAMARIEADAAKAYLALIEKHKDDYARLQKILTGTETVLEDLCRAHPEWFTAKKSVKTPFGTVKMTSGTKLVPADEQRSIALLYRKLTHNKEFPLGDYVRESLELDREGLEKLSDAELAQFDIARVRDDSFSVTPAKVDMGKAVKEAVDAEKKGAA